VSDVIDKTVMAPANVAGVRPPPWSVEARAMIVLAAPLILTQLAQMAIGTTDLILLGRFSQSALAAAAIGNTIFYLGWLAGGGPAAAVAPMIAQHLGARPRARGGVRASLRMGLWAVVITSAIMMPVMWSAEPILRTLGQAPQLAHMAGQFCFILAFGLPFAVGYQALRNFATALGRPRAAMVVMIATIAFNAVAGWILIFGHLGAPRLGIVGSGLATASSAVFSFLAMLAVVHLDPTLRIYRVTRRLHRPARAKLAEVFRLGLPIGMTMTFEAMMFNAMTLLMGTFGTVSLAAHQIALNVGSITFMVPLGIGMAATVRVGVAAGAGDTAGARRAGLTAFGLATCFMVLMGTVIALDSRPIAALYLRSGSAADAAAIALAAVFLKCAAAFQVFDGIQVVGAFSLRGLKDARMPMILAGGAYWLVGAPLCVILALNLNMRGLGVWIGFIVSLATAATAMALRFWMLTRPPKVPVFAPARPQPT
jgi:MATE family multidrug resistance protein